MKVIGDQRVCPHCGYIRDEGTNHRHVEAGTLLQGKYMIGRALSENAEYIGYIGFDEKQNAPVFINEFFPDGLCYRGDDNLVVASQKSEFLSYVEEFLAYFRALARLREVSSLVKVYDIFRENGTVYIVSEWTDGLTLSEFLLRRSGRIDWNEARTMFMPLLSAIETANVAGVSHLGINPENLIVASDGRMYLIGFATAKVRTVGYFKDWDFYKGCTAPEQYVAGASVDRCADIYAFAACLFFALSGCLPKDALKRRHDDRLLVPMKVFKCIPEYVASSLAKALRVSVIERTTSFGQLREGLSGEKIMMLKEGKNIQVSASSKPSVSRSARKDRWLSVFKIAAVAFIILLSGWRGLATAGVTIFPGDVASDVEQAQADQALLDSTGRKKALEGQVATPDLVGMKFEDIVKIAAQKGDYQVLLCDRVFNDSFEGGAIVSQAPAKGVFIKKDSVVAVNVSRGPKARKLPAIKSDSFFDAAGKLMVIGIRAIRVDEFTSDVGKGLVVGYRGRSSGDEMDFDSEVEVVVSKGALPGLKLKTDKQ